MDAVNLSVHAKLSKDSVLRGVSDISMKATTLVSA